METQGESTDIQARVLQNTLAEVASLKRNRSDDTDNNQGVEDNTSAATERCCVICLDSVTEICEAQPCRHRDFDYVCLLNWLQQQPRCPLCKRDVREVRYDFQQQDGGDGNDDDASSKEYKVYIVPPAKKPSAKLQSRDGGIVHPLGREYALNRRTRRFEDRPRPPPRPITEDEILVRRRRVYQQQLYSLHVGTSPGTGYRDLTPQAFETDAELVSRARRWLRRELQVFEFLHSSATTTTSFNAASSSTATTTSTPITTTQTPSTGDRLARRRANNAEFLLEYVVAILKTVDIQGSQGQAEEMLKDFLGRENTRLLLHELKSFLRSPYSLDVWDRKVQYPNPKRRRPEDGEEGEEVGGGRGERRRRSGEGRFHSGSSSARRRRQFEYSGNSSGDGGVGGGGREAERPLSRGMLDSYRPSYSRHYDRRRRSERQYTPD